jgi:glycosyltransferase involved in cell wall biosynthesis
MTCGSFDISIVVCTQNRAAMLRGALASLYDLDADGCNYEIVVVDNGSTDGTQKVIAAAAAESKHPLRGVYEPN